MLGEFVLGLKENPQFESTGKTPEQDPAGEQKPVDGPESVLLKPSEPMLGSLLEDLRDLLGKQAQNDGIIRELHSQLQESRAGLHWKILKTVLTDLVGLYDSLGNAISSPMGSGADVVGVLREFQQDVQDILERQGCSPFLVEGDAFDSKRQQAVRLVETADPALSGLISARKAPGFADENRLLRPEKVEVYVCPAKLRAQNSSEASPPPTTL